jgi:hypothetical protein
VETTAAVIVTSDGGNISERGDLFVQAIIIVSYVLPEFGFGQGNLVDDRHRTLSIRSLAVSRLSRKRDRVFSLLRWDLLAAGDAPGGQ